MSGANILKTCENGLVLKRNPEINRLLFRRHKIIKSMIFTVKNYGFGIWKNALKKKLVSNYLKRVFYNKEINDYLLLSLILAFLPVRSLK